MIFILSDLSVLSKKKYNSHNRFFCNSSWVKIGFRSGYQEIIP